MHVHKSQAETRCTSGEVICHLRGNKESSNIQMWSFCPQGHRSPGERKWALLSCGEITAKDQSWSFVLLHSECFTRRRGPINAHGIEFIELHRRKKGTPGTESCQEHIARRSGTRREWRNLGICLWGPGDVCILNGKQTTNKHIGTAEHVVLSTALLRAFIYSMWKNIWIYNYQNA